jgi:hypothetical protein
MRLEPRDLSLLKIDLPGIGFNEAGNEVDEGGLSGTVRTDHPQDLTSDTEAGRTASICQMIYSNYEPEEEILHHP